jgi:hypothetical protein
MVAIINFGTSVKDTFYYNENKVKDGVAECLLAQNYPMDTDQLNEQMRLNMLLKMVERNPYLKYKSTHITLNFAPEEQLSNDKYLAITNEYMEKIGFGDQPFLVYKHNDSGHPHLHIVTTKIKHDGKSIDTNYIGKYRSEPARKELELKYNLVRAEDQQASLKRMMPLNASKVTYGKQVTKRAISNVLNEVLDKYKYTSLAEFNAILSIYNVIAEQGSETSRTFKNGGLVYRVMDKEGNKVSAPIKASAFFLQPTLKNLEGRYLKNDLERQQYKSKLKSAIDFTLKSKSTGSLKDVSAALFKRQIRLVERRNKDGYLYGITFVDLKNKVVFNGSDLAKDFSAAAMQQRFLKFRWNICAVQERKRRCKKQKKLNH